MWVRDDLILQIEFHPHLSRVSLCDFRCIFYLCQRGSGMTRPYGSSSIRTTLGYLYAIYAFMYLSSGKSRYSSTWLRFLNSALHLALLWVHITFLGVLHPGLLLWAFDCHLGPQSLKQPQQHNGTGQGSLTNETQH